MTYNIYVEVLSSLMISGLDEFKPVPAMGNMKPTTEGYADKYAEKAAKIDKDLEIDPIFAEPYKMDIIVNDGDVVERLHSTAEIFVNFKRIENIAKDLNQQIMIVGYDAQLTMMSIYATFARHGEVAPRIQSFDPFSMLGGSQDLNAIKLSLKLDPSTVVAARQLYRLLPLGDL